MTPVTAENTPELFRIATDGARPDSWDAIFDSKEYEALLQTPEMALMQWVEGLASGLDERGAKPQAKHVRSGGLLTQKSLIVSEGENPLVAKMIRVQNYLGYLDQDLAGLQEDTSLTGQSAVVLTLTLQMLANNFLKDLAN